MRRLLIAILMTGGLAGCALHTSYNVDAQRTHVEFRVGVEEMTVVHGTADLPANIDIDVGSDVVVAVVDATIGGGIIRAVVEGLEATINWISGK